MKSTTPTLLVHGLAAGMASAQSYYKETPGPFSMRPDEKESSYTLAHFYRFAGRGNVPYGNNKRESGFTDNGTNGKLAFAMAAAANLTPDGNKSIDARARATSSQFANYSTGYMLHGAARTSL